MSLYARLAAGVVLVVALLAGWHALTTRYDRQGYERAKAEDRAAAETQAARNRELQRAAEKRYVVQAATQERFIVTTVREIAHEAAPLAACPVPADLRVRLDALRSCALGDSPASCGADGAVRKP